MAWMSQIQTKLQLWYLALKHSQTFTLGGTTLIFSALTRTRSLNECLCLPLFTCTEVLKLETSCLICFDLWMSDMDTEFTILFVECLFTDDCWIVGVFYLYCCRFSTIILSKESWDDSVPHHKHFFFCSGTLVLMLHLGKEPTLCLFFFLSFFYSLLMSTHWWPFGSAWSERRKPRSSAEWCLKRSATKTSTTPMRGKSSFTSKQWNEPCQIVTQYHYSPASIMYLDL